MLKFPYHFDLQKVYIIIMSSLSNLKIENEISNLKMLLQYLKKKTANNWFKLGSDL